MKNIYLFFINLIFLYFFQSNSNQAQTWTRINDFNGDARYGAVSFVVGGNAYIGLGKNATVALTDLWKYNATTDSWTAVASFPGEARLNAVAFVVNGKAYIGSGFNGSYTTKYSNFYEYNPTNNTWSSIADLPQKLSNAVAFAIGNFGYVGLGANETGEVKTFYKYDPTNNTWTTTGTFSGDARQAAQAGVINDKGYVIGGAAYSGMSTSYSDVQEYNPVTNTWSEKVFAHIDLSFSDAAAYTLNEKLHLCYGNKKLIRTYTPSGNIVDDLGINPVTNIAIYKPIAFVLGNNAYFGLGEGTTLNKNIYMYSPPAGPSPQSSNITFSNTTSNSFRITWTSGGGSKRVVFLKKTDQSELANPNNGSSYSANNSFGQGGQLGTSGWYCVYNGTGSSVDVVTLLGNSTYRAMVCEYSGSSGTELYNITSTTNNPANKISRPSILATSGGGSYSTGTNPTGVNVYLNNSEVGVNYQLLKNNTNLNASVPGNGNTISWNNLLAGQYTITATNTSGTVTMSGSATIIEGNLPNIITVTGGGSYCAALSATGISVSLNSSDVGVNYQLLKNGINLNSSVAGTGNTIIWSNLSAGQYTIAATNAVGTITMSGSATIVEIPALNVTISISANKTTLNTGEQVVLTSTSTNGGNSPVYKWYVNQVEKGTNTSYLSYVPTNGDKIWCIFTSTGSCISGNNIKSNEVSLVVNSTTSISEIIEDGYSLYPNPVRKTLNIDFESSLKTYSVEIFSLDGKSIIKKYLASGEQNTKIDVSNLQDGIYFIKIKSDKTTKTKRFIKN